MTPPPIPEDVERFISTHVSSVPLLEAMLLLRAESAHSWDGKRLARRLYMQEHAANVLLVELHGAGILVAEDAGVPSYRYEPPDEQRQMIDRLAASYAKNLVGVSNLIHSRHSRDAALPLELRSRNSNGS